MIVSEFSTSLAKNPQLVWPGESPHSSDVTQTQQQRMRHLVQVSSCSASGNKVKDMEAAPFLHVAAFFLVLFCSDLSTVAASRVTVSVAARNASSTPAGILDSSNWASIAGVIKNGGDQRTDVSKLTAFDKIVFANAKARNAVGRSGDGVFLYQGDIKIPEKDVTRFLRRGASGRKRRAIMRDNKALWKSPIFYELSSSLNSNARKAIQSAVKEWQSVLPCLKWTQGRNANGYIYFFPGEGCYSEVGRSEDTKQEISIGDGCEDHGTVVHEIGSYVYTSRLFNNYSRYPPWWVFTSTLHDCSITILDDGTICNGRIHDGRYREQFYETHALGFWHEQSRPDRDRYIEILWKNILPNMKFNFEKQTTSTVDSRNSQYDYDSIMHYSSTAFAKQWGLTTMRSKTGHKKFGDKDRLSDADKQQAESLYMCNKAKVTTVPTVSPTDSGSGGDLGSGFSS